MAGLRVLPARLLHPAAGEASALAWIALFALFGVLMTFWGVQLLPSSYHLFRQLGSGMPQVGRPRSRLTRLGAVPASRYARPSDRSPRCASPSYRPRSARAARSPRACHIAPPVLEYLAGLTEQVRPGAHEVTLVDANKRDFDPDACDADLVGMTVLTPQAPWAYRTADAPARPRHPGPLRRHPRARPARRGRRRTPTRSSSARPRRSGARSSTTPAAGTLKPRYDGPYAPLEDLPRPITGPAARTATSSASFFTSRGCPHSCAFCSVHELLRPHRAHAADRRGRGRGGGEPASGCSGTSTTTCGA